MESSFGNSSDEACNKAPYQCSSNDTDKHHTSSETSNLVSACSVSVNSSPLEGSDEGEEGFDCSNKSKKFLIEESLKETGPLSDKSEPSSITSLRDVYAGTSSPKGDISECSTDQVESNYRRSVKHDILDSAESDNFKSGEGLESEGLARKSVKSGDQNQDFVKMEMANVNQPPVQSHPAGCRDRLDLLVDVKVCDICGDAGREDLLAICSKCADGAEHIYCMRNKLEQVPRRNWLCEECMSSQETEKNAQVKSERAINSSNRSNQISRHGGTSSTATIKTRLYSDVEAPNASKIRRDKFSSGSQSPTKRNAGDFDSTLVKKRRVETTVVDSAPSRQPISRGTLSKSKSLNISDLKREIQSREESRKKKRTAVIRTNGEASTVDKKTDSCDRKICKSVSFNNVSSGHQNVDQPKVKMISTSTSCVEDLKISKSPKASISIQNKLISKSDKLRVTSPTSGSCTSPSKNVKSILCNARPIETHSSASKNLNPKRSQHFVSSSSPSKPSHHVVREDRGVTGGVKRLRSCLSDVARNPSSPIIPNSSHEQNPKGTLRYNSFPSNSRHRENAGQIAQVKKIQLPKSSNQDEKAHEGSNFGTTSEQIRGGTLQGHKSKCKVIANAAESPRVISPRASVHERGKGEDVDQSNPKDLVPNIFLQSETCRKFAVPSPDFIWKGGFEMLRGERLTGVISGIQAHVCTQASLKAFEVVKKFPCKILLEEVSRLSTWPSQFQQNKPSENNIALYFFAVDLESYEREYKSMVECLMHHDIALKGTIDGLELLIFPSNLLPQKSQRWNNLFYLWGIFRGKKIVSQQRLPTSRNDTPVPNLDTAIPEQDTSLPGRSEFECFKKVDDAKCATSSQNKPVIPDLNNPLQDQAYAIPGGSGAENIPSSGPSSECVSASKLYRSIQHPSNFISPMDLPSASCERNDDNLNPELPYPEQKNFDFQTNFDSKDRDDSHNFRKDQVLADGKQGEGQDLIFAMETGPTENPNNKGSVKLFGAYIS